MAKRRIGALITIELETGVGEYAETGIPINGELTNQLLTNIFTPNTPLHDGAVIIKEIKLLLRHVIYHFQKVHQFLEN